jgi:fucose 4-O-acetylase-like acetyltransferase
VGTLLGLLILMVGLVLLPILFLKVLLSLLLLPFQLLGFVFKLVFGVLGGVVRVGFGLAMALASLLVVLFFVVLLPLLPFLLIGGFLWLVARLARPRPALRVVS